MEMRATEDVATGEDLTPPIYPLAGVLHDSAVGFHCSACFSPLPPDRFRPFVPASSKTYRHVPNDTSTPFYCSTHCSSLDSSLHFSSSESYLFHLFSQTPPPAWGSSSDLRLSLRLLHTFQRLPQEYRVSGDLRNSVGSEMKSSYRNDGVLERIAGLMTNREGLMFGENRDDQYQAFDEGYKDPCGNAESLIERIKEGAKLLAAARRMCQDDFVEIETEEEFLLEEMVLCLVMTNAVEVQDNSGCTIGVAVYGTSFSWIDHSCSPNACYRFSLGQEQNMQQPATRIAPAAKESGSCSGIGKGLAMESDLAFPFPVRSCYGPRVIVRNIKDVRKGEELTIAYTDLLQPKEMRQTELWLKYRFHCSCQRCSAVPTTYVDYALQTPSTASIYHLASSDNELEKVLECIDDVITDYLSVGDPKSCCEKLENLLSHDCLSEEPIEPKAVRSPQKLKLSPFHYLSQNAYTTLASAYKVHAKDKLALSSVAERQKLEEALNMYKRSAAYSLLLAGVVHHLYMFEPAVVAPVANFFTIAGESLSSLARNSLWDSLEPINQDLSLFSTCNWCCLSFKPDSGIPDRNLPLEEVKTRLLNCIAEITPQAWSTLACESSFLKSIQNPVDFGWLTSPESNRSPDFETYFAEPVGKKGSSDEYNAQFRVRLTILGFHCLRYGSLLSGICYGPAEIKQ